ncbi:MULTISPECIES: response regulator transcription factor [Caballeronia]|jgi:two-component system capsular synthesis response regulator RcsB|uniref:LuxR family transcriptional regulator n=1 Tax=Caballeronia zhejiangensis TaxID=871203 RepID=A0A656QI65_9BURK|nr:MULTISPECIES: response regulator transcription factor [Caballeronia]EKS69519.1 two component LuxR family transcriptional regulator [Burkholderia sp. SJ98]KDR29750.1 hypothetical protein BG60_05955 [Caballeronia zhejiangensis]MCG7401643.1 response regulator transcription factor [Caballeronia zhejiangensis]MCI1045214.1 response regulator transcription factor [Caballeronia zhejiangensis]MDR5767110.1 response regulator transcription factor [Caballeronia sp. LZ028]
MAKDIRVAIVDDHPIVLCGLNKALLEAGFNVRGVESSADGLMNVLENEACDVVVADYSMPDASSLDGWQFLTALSSKYPKLPVVVFSEFDDPFLVGSLAQRGVAGVVSKRENMSEMLVAIHTLFAGGRYLSPVAQSAVERFNVSPELSRFTALTRRQMEIAGLMLCGLSVCETARLLDRRMNTISSQRAAACKRLGFSRESEMYRFAASHGLSLERSQIGVEFDAIRG